MVLAVVENYLGQVSQFRAGFPFIEVSGERSLA